MIFGSVDAAPISAAPPSSNSRLETRHIADSSCFWIVRQAASLSLFPIVVNWQQGGESRSQRQAGSLSDSALAHGTDTIFSAGNLRALPKLRSFHHGI